MARKGVLRWLTNDAKVLVDIERHHGDTAIVRARRIGITERTVHEIIGLLLRHGLIYRNTNSPGGRTRAWELSDLGENLARALAQLELWDEDE